jgi:hypothetical protein
MRKFDKDQALAAVELKQLLADYCHELDANKGRNLTQYFTEDCIVDVGVIKYQGHAEMRQHYIDHGEAVAKMKDASHTARHGFTNFKVTFENADRATVTYLVVNFSAEGKEPIMNGSTPSVITDCRFECRREADGQWKVFAFYGAPIFVGNDPYLTKAVVGDKH